MIVTVLRLTRWEFFKLRRRWMPWILVAVAAALCQSFLWSQYYEYVVRVPFHEQSFFGLPGPVVAEDGRRAVVPISCADIWDETIDDKLARSAPELMEESTELVESMREEHCPNSLEAAARFFESTRQIVVLPNSVSNAIVIAQTIGIVLIMILAASSMGGEYGWGTLRLALTRGIGRWQLLGAKVLSMLLLIGGGLIIAALTIALSSLVTASLIIEDGGGLADAGEWSTLAVLFGKAVYGLMAYAMLAIFLSVLTSSSSMGIAFSLAYFFAELIVFLTVRRLFDWFENVSNFLLGPSVTAGMIETGVHTTSPQLTLFPSKDPPSELHAFLVVTSYMLIAGVAAVWLFQRKDIAGARGE